jgi:hypothetical protein
MRKVITLTVFMIGVGLLSAGAMSAQSSVAGEWDASMNTPGGARPFKLVFKVDGEKLSGTVKRANGDVPLQGTIKGKDISFAYSINYNGNDLQLSFTGKVNGDAISGTVSFGGNAEDEWSAKRVPAAKPKTD